MASEDRINSLIMRTNQLDDQLLHTMSHLTAYLQSDQRVNTENISYRKMFEDASTVGGKSARVVVALLLGFATDTMNLLFKLVALSPFLLTLFEVASVIWLTKQVVKILDDIVLTFLNGIESSINPFINFLNDYFVDVLRDVLNRLCSFCICIRIGPINISSHVFRFLCPHFNNIPNVNIAGSGRWTTILDTLKDLQCDGNFVSLAFSEIFFTVRLYTSTSVCRLLDSVRDVPIVEDVLRALLGWLTFGGERCTSPDEVEEWICYILNSYTVIYLAILIYLIVLAIDEYWPRFLGPLWDFVKTLTYKTFRLLRWDLEKMSNRRYDHRGKKER